MQVNEPGCIRVTIRFWPVGRQKGSGSADDVAGRMDKKKGEGQRVAAAMDEVLIVFNVGSSTLKVQATRLAAPEHPLFRVGIELATGITQGREGLPASFPVFTPSHTLEDMAMLVVSHVMESGMRVAGVLHRVVHGGRRHREPQWVNDALLQELQRLEMLCPLHQAPALELVHHLRTLWPALPQMTVFDTAFHRGQPALATTYALPAALRLQGIAAYGFHGISCQHVRRQLRAQHPALANARVLVAHLGQGASLSAVHHGESVACSMGFSTLDGLPMGTRCGELDAGVLLYLMEMGWSKSRLTDLLYHQSGLLGLSGSSADMRQLLAGKTEAERFAVDYFCYRAARMAASLTCAMEGLDVLVFTGGIGEHQPAIREKICERLRWMGVDIDSSTNQIGHGMVSQATSVCRILVVKADEEGEMVQQCRPHFLKGMDLRAGPAAR